MKHSVIETLFFSESCKLLQFWSWRFTYPHIFPLLGGHLVVETQLMALWCMHSWQVYLAFCEMWNIHVLHTSCKEVALLCEPTPLVAKLKSINSWFHHCVLAWRAFDLTDWSLEEEELCLKSMHFSSNPGGYEFFHTLLWRCHLAEGSQNILFQHKFDVIHCIINPSCWEGTYPSYSCLKNKSEEQSF